MMFLRKNKDQLRSDQITVLYMLWELSDCDMYNIMTWLNN